MLTKVQKWGNSLGLVRRPHARKYALRELLQGITKGNLHGEVRSGGPDGREGW